MNKKLGFCCKFKDPTGKLDEKQYNVKTTTLRYIKTLTKKEQDIYLNQIIEHNINHLNLIWNYLDSLPKELQMFRLSSELLPFYSHPDFTWFWKSKSIQHKIKKYFYQLGKKSLEKQYRLSFHPGQFTVINSINEKVNKNSIRELEYHADMARYMGYTDEWHKDGFACNIHVGSKKGGISTFLKNFKKLSNECKKILTVENDEYSFGVNEFLPLGEYVALVLDIHHHWCSTGEYIKLDDPRVADIKKSWRGIRPKIHYSHSRLDIFQTKPDLNKKLDHTSLMKQDLKIKDLRKHSDIYWNKEANIWALSFLPEFDIQCEAKFKNIASKDLLNYMSE